MAIHLGLMRPRRRGLVLAAVGMSMALTPLDSGKAMGSPEDRLSKVVDRALEADPRLVNDRGPESGVRVATGE